mmetsp:Transcript_49420/g.94458  ORF Transcript_49420/g.94458 Transcript_49420/m.94458 type:complete len:245 (+) Transcript_49420:169-903(+)
MKYWQWSSDRGCTDRMIWCRSVSISSYTMYTSWKVSRWRGRMTSRRPMTFSCWRWRSSLISRSTRRASTTFSNAPPIFLMATFSWFSSLQAEHTMPYAPLPMGLTGLYLASTSNMFPHTMKCARPEALASAGSMGASSPEPGAGPATATGVPSMLVRVRKLLLPCRPVLNPKPYPATNSRPRGAVVALQPSSAERRTTPGLEQTKDTALEAPSCVLRRLARCDTCRLPAAARRGEGTTPSSSQE